MFVNLHKLGLWDLTSFAYIRLMRFKRAIPHGMWEILFVSVLWAWKHLM